MIPYHYTSVPGVDDTWKNSWSWYPGISKMSPWYYLKLLSSDTKKQI